MSSSVFVTAKSHCVEISTTLCQDLKIAIQCKLLVFWKCESVHLWGCHSVVFTAATFCPSVFFKIIDSILVDVGDLQFSRLVVSDSATLWTAACQASLHHQLPELTYSCPLSRWCHPTISSSVVPFSSCLHSFPGSGSFPVSHFASGGQVLEFQLQHQSIHWYSGLISFRMDWLDLFAAQGTL